MSNRSLIACLGWLLLSAIPGQTASPIVNVPTGDALWTIDISYPKNPTGNILVPENHMLKAEVTRKSGMRRDRIWWSATAESEVWISETARLRVYENPDNRAIYVIPFSDSTMTVFVPRDFNEDMFQWVTPALHTGVENFDGRPCDVFAGNISRTFTLPGMQATSITIPPMPHKLWLDAETHQPVAMDTGVALYKFRFSEAPPEPLVMPDRLQKALDRYLADLTPSKRVERLRARAQGK